MNTFLTLVAAFAISLTGLGLNGSEARAVSRTELRPDTHGVVLPGYRTVPSVLVAGCTAILANDGNDIQWVGCPTTACGDPYNDPCQAHIGAFRVWCECDGDVLCRSKVAFNLDATVQGWLCETDACNQACTKSVAPFPLPGESQVYFYACDC